MHTQEKNWYIAIVGNKTERKTADALSQDYEVYVPSQQVISIWADGRKKLREKVMIPGKVLVYCTERQRREICYHPAVKRFMVDIASEPDESGRRSIAIVPPEQVEMMKFILGQSECKVTIDNENLQTGERVRVIRGVMLGLEGTVSDWTTANTKIHINIDHLGCASVEVGIEDIERI